MTNSAWDVPNANPVRLKVIGVGGGGSNAVDRLISVGVGGVDYIAANTDAQALTKSLAPTHIRLGAKGLGAGGKPTVGAAAAYESISVIEDTLRGANMVFVTAGMGGGTGTGAAPVIADVAQKLGALTIGVVTMPFEFEGGQRRATAEAGLKELRKHVNTLLTIPNQKLLKAVGAKVPLEKAFRVADDVLRQGIQGISELVTTPGLINLDFADVKAVMENGGTAILAIAEAEGIGRVLRATQQAIVSPLLGSSIEGARGVLLNFRGGYDLSLHEISAAAQIVYEAVSPDANIFFGAITDETMQDKVRVTIIATGFDQEQEFIPPPTTAPQPEHADDSDIPAFIRRSFRSPLDPTQPPR